MRSKAVIVARVLLGLVFFVFGLNGFLHWFPLPTMKGAAAEFMGGLVARWSILQSHYRFRTEKMVTRC